MQDIRWNVFWLGLGLILLCLILWAISSANIALIVFAAGVIVYLAGHLYWLHQLYTWLKKPVLKDIPVGVGIWEDVFAAIYHEERKHMRGKTQLSYELDRFKHAASALPDGIVVLNSDNEIEWCNPPAETQLGLDLSHDLSQPISYLVRHSDFLSYLQTQESIEAANLVAIESNLAQYSANQIEPIKLTSWRNPEITLEIQLIPFGTKQKLLICRDITALEKTEVMRRDFIANVSHELRTPLTVVGGFLETLGDMEGAVPESSKNYFNMMLDQTSRMRRIIEDLLTLSQIESNAQSPDDTEIDMGRLLKLIHNDAKALSNGKHNIMLDADNSLNINGAQEELLSAFSNLVSNAIRYTPAKSEQDSGNIFITWQLLHNQAVFSVRDTGIGIEAHHISRLTERFYRVDRGRSRETGGTGLGLAIVKHILNRHQAKLEIDSEIAVGSTFSIVFAQSRVAKKHLTLVA